MVNRGIKGCDSITWDFNEGPLVYHVGLNCKLSHCFFNWVHASVFYAKKVFKFKTVSGISLFKRWMSLLTMKVWGTFLKLKYKILL